MLRKKVLNSKRPYESTIQEYKKVNRMVKKKKVKKAKRKKLDEKVMKLEDDFKSNDSHNLFKSVQELEAKPKKSLMVAKNQKKNKSRKTEEVLLKFGKNISNKTSIWNFLKCLPENSLAIALHSIHRKVLSKILFSKILEKNRVIY